MSDRIPLGRKEDARLEFKAAGALRTPEKIAREIVGMLNAEGGDVWIGVTEREGVAVSVEHLPNAEYAQRMLLDHLVETVEPPPRNDEIVINQVRDGAGATVLVVHVNPVPARQPYAHRTRAGRYFGLRVADRLRTMSWDEIFAPSAAVPAGEDPWLAARKDVTARLDDALKNPDPRFWLYLKPVVPMHLRFGSETEDLFRDPDKTDNRPNGWTFVDRRIHIDRASGRIVHGERHGRQTEVRRDGSILFTAPLAYLHWKGEHQLIWPYILIEFAVSVFKLAAHLYADEVRLDGERLATQLALISARGWKLKAGSVRSVRWQFDEPSVLAKDHAISQVRAQRLNQVVETPGACPYPLIQDIYEEFALDRDDLPSEFDPVTGMEFPA